MVHALDISLGAHFAQPTTKSHDYVLPTCNKVRFLPQHFTKCINFFFYMYTVTSTCDVCFTADGKLPALNKSYTSMQARPTAWTATHTYTNAPPKGISRTFPALAYARPTLCSQVHRLHKNHQFCAILLPPPPPNIPVILFNELSYFQMPDTCVPNTTSK